MTILIADDHPIVGVALELNLAKFLPQANVVLCESFPAVLDTLDQCDIDVVVLDIDIPGSENSQMVKLIKEKKSTVLILIYSGLDEKLYALPYMKAGADGFLSKTAPHAEFATALTTVLQNGKYISRDIQQLWLSQLSEKQEVLAENPLQKLSKGERDVLHMLIEGRWPKEIAKVMNLKATTISTYKKKIFEKLDVANTIELIQKVNRLKHL